VPQPSQKHFDTLIWEQLRTFNPEEVIFLESESKKVGNLSVPEDLILKMRQSPCTHLELSMSSRVELLMEDYAFMANSPEHFAHKLQALIPLRGKALIDGWQEMIENNKIREVVEELLEKHYDPTYDASMKRNFQNIENANRLTLASLEQLQDLRLAQDVCEAAMAQPAS
jgi:tRNA 2-selenouridine synthase